MKYKIGDRVRIVSVRVPGMNPKRKMDRWLGQVMTISAIGEFFDDVYYEMKEDDGRWKWDNNMIAGLAEPELTAEEAFKILGEIRRCRFDRERRCASCPISQYKNGITLCADNYGIRVSDSESLLEICKQWKADHEKKEPEVETVDICRIEKILPDGSACRVHEEDIKPAPDLPYGSEREAVERILKRYCMEHEGTYRAVYEVVSRVKAVK